MTEDDWNAITYILWWIAACGAFVFWLVAVFRLDWTGILLWGLALGVAVWELGLRPGARKRL